MKWMIDSDFFNERIARNCNSPQTPHDNTSERKLLALIQMLCESVNGKSWRDAADMAMMLRRPIKQCERVWQLCIEENVLRPVEDGYSAIEWMREKGYFNDSWRNENQQNFNRRPYHASASQQLPKNAF